MRTATNMVMTSNDVRMREGIRILLRPILVLAIVAAPMLLSAEVSAQTNGVVAEAARQVPAPLPKLALNGAVAETKSGVQYHRIVLMITNWDRYSAEMFFLPAGRRLPPSPCALISTRVAISVYSDRGVLLAGCIAMPKPADLGKFSFLVQKAKTVPDFIYAVMIDRYTGGVYRSNLVSPWSGATK